MKRKEWVLKNRKQIVALALSHGMTDLRLFGSVARGEDRPDSDIDFIVKRRSGTDPFEIVLLKEELEKLLGTKVDVLTEHPGMRPRLRESILCDALAI